MTSQEVQAFFQDDNLTDEQMNLVHEFLMSQKVEVIGYTGTIENTEKTEQEEKDTSSQQEKDYVAEYLIDIEKMAKQTEEEVTLAYYLPKVVEEAVKLHMPGIFIGDVIPGRQCQLDAVLKVRRRKQQKQKCWSRCALESG